MKKRNQFGKAGFSFLLVALLACLGIIFLKVTSGYSLQVDSVNVLNPSGPCTPGRPCAATITPLVVTSAGGGIAPNPNGTPAPVSVISTVTVNQGAPNNDANAWTARISALNSGLNFNTSPFGTQTPTATPNPTQMPAMEATVQAQISALQTEVPVPTIPVYPTQIPISATLTPQPTPALASLQSQEVTPIVAIATNIPTITFNQQLQLTPEVGFNNKAVTMDTGHIAYAATPQVQSFVYDGTNTAAVTTNNPGSAQSALVTRSMLFVPSGASLGLRANTDNTAYGATDLAVNCPIMLQGATGNTGYKWREVDADSNTMTALGVGAVGFANYYFPFSAFTATGAATPITFGGNSLANFGAQVDIGAGITNLTAQLLLSYDGGLSYPVTGASFSSITATTATMNNENVGATNMKVNVSAWTLSATPTVTIYPLAR